MPRVICFILHPNGFYFTHSQAIIYDSDQLQIKQIAKNSYLHISYLETEKWGRVGCNGLVVLSKNESVVFDTPVNELASKELIGWLTDSMQTSIQPVVVNHHHIDCLGGLPIFHQKSFRQSRQALLEN